MSGVAQWGDATSPFQFAGKQPIGRCEDDTTLARYTEGHLGFHGWMRAVDHAILRRAGIGAFDLPDRGWRDLYEDRTLPREAAFEALEEEGFPAG